MDVNKTTRLKGICDICQKPCSSRAKHCSPTCKATAERNKSLENLRHQLSHQNQSNLFELNYNPLGKPEEFHTLGQVIDALILRLCSNKENESAYWPLAATNALIVTLGNIREISYRDYMQAMRGEAHDTALKNLHLNRTNLPHCIGDAVIKAANNDDFIRSIWMVVVSQFLLDHIIGNSFYNRINPGQVISGKLHGVGGEEFRSWTLFSPSEKSDLTNTLGRKCKGVVPPNCSLEGEAMKAGNFGEHPAPAELNLSHGDEFFVDIFRCPFSTGIYDRISFIAKKESTQVNLLASDIGANLIVQKVAENDSYGPRSTNGEIPLHWITHFRKNNEWHKCPDWQMEADQIVNETIIRRHDNN